MLCQAHTGRILAKYRLYYATTRKGQKQDQTLSYGTHIARIY